MPLVVGWASNERYLWLNGRHDDWPTIDTAAWLQIRLEEDRWFVAVQLPEDGPNAVEIELRLPGGVVPDIGEIVRGGGNYEVDCVKLPWEQGERPLAERRRCEATVSQYNKLVAAEAARHRKIYRFPDSAWARADSGARQKCEILKSVQRCEIELPLTALPRTSDVELTGLHVGLPALVPPPSAVLRYDDPAWAAPTEEGWLDLKQEKGTCLGPECQLRKSVFPDKEPRTDQPRYTYQPGTRGWEELERVSRMNAVGQVERDQCKLGPAIVEFGSIQLREACRLVYVWRDGQLQGNSPFILADQLDIRIRGGLLIVVSNSRGTGEFDDNPESWWKVHIFDTREGRGAQRLRSKDATREPNAIWRTLRAEHSPDYGELRFVGQTELPDGSRKRHRLVWRVNTC